MNFHAINSDKRSEKFLRLVNHVETCEVSFLQIRKLSSSNNSLNGHSVVLCDFVLSSRKALQGVIVEKKKGAEGLQVTEEKVGFPENIESCKRPFSRTLL